MSDSLRQRLSALKWMLIDRVGVAPFVRAIELMPRTQAVRIIESLQLTGHLDYPASQIDMELRSVAELSRLRSCQKEPLTVEWIEREIREGDVLYDVGANVGAYSLIAFASAAGRCRVYAFEPSYATFSALCTNLRINNCGEAVVPLPLALSDQTGVLPFNYSSVRVGAALHSVGEPLDMYGLPFKPAFVQPVLSYKLDDLVSSFHLEPPTHIKIDVDGAELLVLHGAAQALASPRMRSVLIEVKLESEMCAQIEQYLGSRGYEFRTLGKSVTPGFANYEFGRPHR